MTRFNPTRQVLTGPLGTTDVSDDVMSINFRDAITNQAGTFTIELDDRRSRYSGGINPTGILLAWNQPVKIYLDGTLKFKGRIDKPIAHAMKKDALTYPLEGRSDLGALQDIVTSYHVADRDANQLINDLLTLYNSLRGSADPAITVGSISPAQNSLTLSFQWKRKSIYEMLLEIADALGSPLSLGGLNLFFDFWMDPQDKFYFRPIGAFDSQVNLGTIGMQEIKQQDYVIDAYPVKNDVWVWAGNVAGRIPLEMQYGYTGAGLVADPWTENNASDWKAGTHVTAISDDASTSVIGSKCIEIALATGMNPNDQAYFYMPIPFGSGGSKWPRQLPGGGMNTFNETRLHETMGEMTLMQYYLNIGDSAGGGTILRGSMDHWIQIKDGNALLADSEVLTLPTAQNTPASTLPAGWQFVSFPFGPQVSYSPPTFDWANVAEVRFMFRTKVSTGAFAYALRFDGFRIAKPLVVNVQDASVSTTRRTTIKVAAGLLTYPIAKLYARSLLEQLLAPQQYYSIKNLGRADIPAGYLFQANGKSLLARELVYDYKKGEGWLVDLTGFEKT